MIFPSLFAAAPPPHSGLGFYDVVGIIAYLLVTLGIVVWASRKQNDTDDFFLGGRQLPWFAVGLSIMATLFSSISYVGNSGEIIKNGMVTFYKYLAYIPSVGVIIYLFIPFFMRLRLTSGYEYLERRFDRRVQLLGGVMFIWMRIGWISTVMFAGSLAMSRMMGMPTVYVIMALGLLATVYAWFGGMKAVIWNDVLQAVMLFGGAGLILVYVMATTGSGIDDWWARASSGSAGRTAPIFFDFNPFVRATILTAIIDGFFWQICTHSSDQVVLQRYFTTTSVRSARNSFLINITASLSITVLLAISGLALLYFYLEYPGYLGDGLTVSLDPSKMSKADEIMPYFYAHQLPIGIGGLILAAFLCDAMQTLVSGVNSISAVVSGDMFEQKSKSSTDAIGIASHSKADDAKQLLFARITTVLVGLLCTGVACFIPSINAETGRNIIDLMPRLFNFLLGPMSTLFVAGMFMPHVGARAVLVGSLTSLTTAILWCWANELGLTGDRGDLSPFWVVGLASMTGYSTTWLAGHVLERKPPKGLDFTWREVMKRPAPVESD
jgi:SSS family solute:Na+ symporter